VTRSSTLSLLTIDQLVGVQRSAIVRCACWLLVLFGDCLKIVVSGDCLFRLIKHSHHTMFSVVYWSMVMSVCLSVRPSVCLSVTFVLFLCPFVLVICGPSFGLIKHRIQTSFERSDSDIFRNVAKFRYCDDMLSVVCLSCVTRVYCDKTTANRITRFSQQRSLGYQQLGWSVWNEIQRGPFDRGST